MSENDGEKNSEKREPCKVLVYDIGASTVEASLLLIDGKKYQLLDFEYDLFFGGNDFDLQLAEK
jgi:molecular chaperone DnaK (HSP70)